MTDSEYLEAVLLRHFFHVENEKTEMLDKEEKGNGQKNINVRFEVEDEIGTENSLDR